MSRDLHVLDESGEFCDCGADTALCQRCGRVKCGTMVVWIPVHPDRSLPLGRHGNVCIRCATPAEWVAGLDAALERAQAAKARAAKRDVDRANGN